MWGCSRCNQPSLVPVGYGGDEAVGGIGMEVGQFNRCQCNRPIQRELLEAGNAIRLCACSMAASQKRMAIRDPGPNWGEGLSLGSDLR